LTCFGFIGPKKTTKEKKPGKGGNRFWKNVGLGFKTPQEAIEGIDFIPQPCVLAHRVL
jgi:small subunit ribosomal protein S11e